MYLDLIAPKYLWPLKPKYCTVALISSNNFSLWYKASNWLHIFHVLHKKQIYRYRYSKLMNLIINIPYQEDGKSNKHCYLRKHFRDQGFESKLDKISYTDFKHELPFRLAGCFFLWLSTHLCQNFTFFLNTKTTMQKSGIPPLSTVWFWSCGQIY